jgi:G3E family GTPase
MTPVSIVTGFLGSGKTTPIGHVPRDPAFARAAVIVNEFGEIGLDHELIASGNETFPALTTGCLCRAVRGDLIETLLELGECAGGLFDRALIETSGPADPARGDAVVAGIDGTSRRSADPSQGFRFN